MKHFISINFIRKSNLIDCVFKMGGLKTFKYFERWLICLATFISMQISIYLKYNRKFWDVLTLDWRRVCVCVCHLYWDCKNQLLSTCKSLQALKWARFFFSFYFQYMSRNRFTRIDLTVLKIYWTDSVFFKRRQIHTPYQKNNHWLSLSMISACMFIRNQKERERGSEQIKNTRWKQYAQMLIPKHVTYVLWFIAL